MRGVVLAAGAAPLGEIVFQPTVVEGLEVPVSDSPQERAPVLAMGVVNQSWVSNSVGGLPFAAHCMSFNCSYQNSLYSLSDMA
jgi:hypothetical protein